MVALRHKGRPDERPIEVHEDAVESWAGFGYEPVEDKKAASRKPTARKASTDKK